MGFDKIAKVVGNIVRYIVEGISKEEPQVLLHVLVGDLSSIFKACHGGPLEYPIFILFTKCILLELVQFAYSNILDSKQEFNMSTKLVVLDLL